MVENIPVKAGDVGPISGSGRSPGEGNGKPWERLLNEYRVSEVAEKHYSVNILITTELYTLK